MWDPFDTAIFTFKPGEVIFVGDFVKTLLLCNDNGGTGTSPSPISSVKSMQMFILGWAVETTSSVVVFDGEVDG